VISSVILYFSRDFLGSYIIFRFVYLVHRWFYDFLACYTGFLFGYLCFLGRYMGFFGSSIDFPRWLWVIKYKDNIPGQVIVIIIAEIQEQLENIGYNNKRNTIMIVVIMVLETTTAPQLNNILQYLERCEVSKGVRQRAADLSIAVQITAHK
jgi:hypothetical protein